MKKGKDTYIAFLDTGNAFDKVEGKLLFQILREAGIKYRDRRVIWSLYSEGKAVIRCGEHQQKATIGLGVLQGCSLSTVIFNGYIQKGLE